MIKNTKDLLYYLLSVIGYTGDQDELVEYLLTLCHEEAFFSIIDTLPEDVQTKVQARLTSASDESHATIDLLRQYISETTYVEALKNATEKVIRDFIDSIRSTLTAEQKISLDTYLSALA